MNTNIKHLCDYCKEVKPVTELEYIHGKTETHTFSGVICNDCKEKQHED